MERRRLSWSSSPSYEVVVRAPYLGEARTWIGGAAGKPLDRATVEVLVGETAP